MELARTVHTLADVLVMRTCIVYTLADVQKEPFSVPYRSAVRTIPTHLPTPTRPACWFPLPYRGTQQTAESPTRC